MMRQGLLAQIATPAPLQWYPGHCALLLPSLACDPVTCYQESYLHLYHYCF